MAHAGVTKVDGVGSLTVMADPVSQDQSRGLAADLFNRVWALLVADLATLPA